MQLNEREYLQSVHAHRFLYLIAFIVIGFNLRPALTSVGSMLGIIRDQLQLANWSAGLLTSLPLIAFAVMSPVAPKVGRKLGNVRAMFVGLLIALVGICVRSIPTSPTLFIGTIVLGIGIATLNVLLPAVIKERFPDKVGQMTSVYSTSMVVFAAFGSGVSVTIAENLGVGWEISLLVWVVLIIIGIAVWLVVMHREKAEYRYDTLNNVTQTKSEQVNIWKSALAWQVTLYMGFQATCFYVIISWLPEILVSEGFSIVVAGWLISYAQFISLPATFFTPVIATKFKNQQLLAFLLGMLFVIGFIGILIGGSSILLIVWVTLLGFTTGATVSLSLTFIGLRAKNAHQASDLSGMVQSVGYVLPAIGPLFIGLLFDWTNAWTIPLITMVIISLCVSLVGLGAGRDKYVGHEKN